MFAVAGRVGGNPRGGPNGQRAVGLDAGRAHENLSLHGQSQFGDRRGRGKQENFHRSYNGFEKIRCVSCTILFAAQN